MPPSTLDQFRAAVMADALAQAHLAEPRDPAVFEARALAWARARGMALTPADLIESSRPDPLGLQRFFQAPLVQPDWPPQGWLPASFAPFPEPAIQWLNFAGVSPSRPFFEDAVREAADRPFNRLFRIATPLAGFLGRANPRPPSGFIFHMSRCGSTLVSQMLGAGPGHVSISEAAPLDAMIQCRFADAEAHADALRGLVDAYARGAGHLFVKLDSWHTRALPLLRRAFPETPWIFLYRDPVEVLVSQQRLRGVQTVPGVVPLEWFGLAPEAAQLPERAFIARILERTCSAVIEHGGGKGLLVNYAELPQAVFDRILPHFGVAPDAVALTAMTAASTRYSKAPTVRFHADGAGKQRDADDELRTTAEQYLAPVFAALEARRATA
ncbi:MULTISPECIES: sulfotransferase [unclassified Sphingomonas]|uniref:sulfotransferase n=6 Tax=Bacteria TaxID=2 RepID=UPI0010F716AF|nr:MULTISPECIES: sulfotransferase [unclassified Sphingomonas]